MLTFDKVYGVISEYLPNTSKDLATILSYRCFDLASFYNQPIETVYDNVVAFIKGDRRAMLSYGIVSPNGGDGPVVEIALADWLLEQSEDAKGDVCNRLMMAREGR